ncbi:MAG: imidazoleglycerol-phosphate dehydratase HisB [Christensenellales bacterium]
MREAKIDRKTKETDISLYLNLDGNGNYEIDTGCGFLDHMLELLSSHSLFDLKVKCIGDVKVDYHHTVEDIGICLGTAFKEALQDKKGITRYADVTIPMDESLVMCAVDVSGRCYLLYDLIIKQSKVGDFDTELVEEFFWGFCRSASVTLDFIQLAGKNTHHIIECAFKAFARALKAAVKVDERLKDKIPSSKGVL